MTQSERELYRGYFHAVLLLLIVAVGALAVNALALFWVSKNQTAILSETYHSLSR